MGGSVPSEDGFMNGVICVLRDCPTQSKVRTLEDILLRIFFCWFGIFTKYVDTHLCCGSHAIQVLISSTTGMYGYLYPPGPAPVPCASAVCAELKRRADRASPLSTFIYPPKKRTKTIGAYFRVVDAERAMTQRCPQPWLRANYSPTSLGSFEVA